MNALELSRRSFFTAVGGALTLGFQVGCGGAQSKIIKHAEQTGELIPNMFVSVKRDGRIGLAINKVEFGQGVTTAYATLVAEELDVPIESVDFFFADSLPEYRTSYGVALTGGSSSVREAYIPLRKAAASAREMLALAAANEWQVPRAEVRTDGGFVTHEKSNRKIGYGELTVKASRLEVPDAPRLKERSEFRLIGKRSLRNDSRFKVTGTARFGIDVVVPNMVKACIIHGPVYGAEPKTIQADAAKKMPGVIDVVPLRTGVAVVAEKYWQALAAMKAVTVGWTAGDIPNLDTEKLRTSVHAYAKDGETVRDDGNAKSEFEKSPAAKRIEATYDAPYLAHATMEPQNATVHVKGDGKVEVWAPCQSPTILQGFVADAVGVAVDDVYVHTTYAGGGFGRRLIGEFAAEAAILSKRVKRPVQLIWSRESDITQGFYRPQSSARIRGSMSDDGQTIKSLDIHVLSQSIVLDSADFLKGIMIGLPGAVQNVVVSSLLGMVGSNTLPDFIMVEGASPFYAIENVRVAYTPVHTKLPVCSWRSVGNSVNAFYVEGMVDELARGAKQDPLEIRRRMLSVRGNDEENAKRTRALRVLDAVAAMSKWGSTRSPGIGRGLARHFSFETEVAEVADVEIVDGRIKVRRVWAAVECGVVINPDIVRAQVEGAILFGLSAALDQEITLKNGVVEQNNFDTFPVLRMIESPEITVQIVESDRNSTGIGEPGLPPIAPAVANAIFDLTGTRLRQMPFQRSFDEVRR